MAGDPRQPPHCKQCGREGVTLCTFCDIDQVRLFFRGMRAIAERRERLEK